MCHKIPFHFKAKNTIIGNDNTVSSLLNVPLNVDATANVLSNVERKVKPRQFGLLSGDLLGGLLDDDPLGDLLGNTLDDLFGGLLARDAVTHNSNVNGHDLVNKLLGGVLGSVEQLVDNLLHLLVNLLEAVLKSVPKGELPQHEDPIVCSSGASTSQGGKLMRLFITEKHWKLFSFFFRFPN